MKELIKKNIPCNFANLKYFSTIGLVSNVAMKNKSKS